MKRFLATTVAISLALAPMALAQTAPPHPDQHPPKDDHAAVKKDDHPATVQHTTTVQHSTTVKHTTTVQNGLWTGHPPTGDGHPPGFGQPGGGPGYHQPAFPQHSWRKGDRYTGSRQVVTNWSDYHVQRPPDGYEYVRDGNQLVLIAIVSGVIASVLANALYQ